MISGAAFCPHPPVLVPVAARGAASELDALRAACSTAIGRVARGGGQLVLLGSGESSRFYPSTMRGSLAGYGVPVQVHLGAPGGDGPPELPLSLTVGAWLVTAALGAHSGAVGVSAGPDFAGSSAAAELLALVESDEVALLVMGDGTARRAVKAPGYLDERSAALDAGVTDALRTGDAAALGRLDPRLGAELLAAGVLAWRVAGGLLDGHRYDAELLYADDPYGVAYLVAVWTATATADG